MAVDKLRVTEKEISEIIKDMPFNRAAAFTYKGRPMYLLLKNMDEEAQLSALRTLKRVRQL